MGSYRQGAIVGVFSIIKNISLSICVYMTLFLSIIFADVRVVIARDFGKVGHTYEIAEQDIIEYIKEKLSKIDLDALNKEMQAKVKQDIERPKVVENIENAKEDKEFYYDPTFILEESIYDHKGVLIHPMGAVINPLGKTALLTPLIFIDGDQEKHIQYALAQNKLLKGSTKIILVKGSPLALQKQYKVWIYFDQFGFLTSKLGIKHIPAIVRQDGLKLKINEVALK